MHFLKIRPSFLAGRIRNLAEDFSVEEIQSTQFSGDGEHLWLLIKKRGCNTQFVAQKIAEALSVDRRNVSYAGLKDRHAETTQWFSAQIPGKASPESLELGEGIEVLQMRRHHKKLQRGQLEGNRFSIIIRNVEGDGDQFQDAFDTVGASGVPNYFGEQRFGRDFGNLDKSLRMFERKYKPKNRNERGLLISTARSYLFNLVVSERIEKGLWSKIIPGDVMNLDGSQSVFVPDQIDDELRQRLSSGDVHITGPLYGVGESMVLDQALKLEREVFTQNPKYTEGLLKLKVKAARRSIRIIPKEMNFEWLDTKTLRLEFSLPAGAYATSVLRELVDYTVAQPAT